MAKFDLIVIGAGAAGSKCATKVNEAGMKVALIERDALGGTCLNYGCDPTKTVLHSVKLLHNARRGHRYGLDIPDASAKWHVLLNRIQTVQRKMRGGTREEARAQMGQRGIELIMGEGTFVSAHKVAVNGRTLQADHILIATGTEPTIPDIPGLAQAGYITNKTVFNLSRPPGHLIIMGAGPIGIEFAQFFARLGSSVEVIEAESQILPQDDPELASELAAILRDEGVTIRTQAKITAVSAQDRGKEITILYENGYEENIVTSELLVAAGRKAAIPELNLNAAGVFVRHDQIQVDEALRTNVPHIWAAGDVSADYPFTHVAWRQGEHVANNILNKTAKPFAKEPIPWVTYTDPELAHVGQTEAELQEAGIPYRTVTQAMEDVARAIATDQTQGRIKLLVAEDDQILGGHILAANGGELIAPLILAMRANIPATVLADTVWPYPTMSAVLANAAGSKA